MNTKNFSRIHRRRAFTLIELLVVIAIIAILASILFPAFSAIKRSGTIKRSQAELKKVALAIEAYKAQLGHYPPENPDNFAVNQLYYELVGTKLVNNGNEYQTETGQGTILTNSFPAFFGGNKVAGFVNVTRGGGDEVQNSKNFVVGLAPAQYLEITTNGVSGIVLGTTIRGPLMLSDPAQKQINPWRYASGSATNNPGQYDLWVDIVVGGKTNRISNWSEKPQIVFY
jgi:prepilin-type N-terminal cleavage/methylation domain-containing protein